MNRLVLIFKRKPFAKKMLEIAIVGVSLALCQYSFVPRKVYPSTFNGEPFIHRQLRLMSSRVPFSSFTKRTFALIIVHMLSTLMCYIVRNVSIHVSIHIAYQK